MQLARFIKSIICPIVLFSRVLVTQSMEKLRSLEARIGKLCDRLKVFDGTLTPTEHKLNINLSLRGNGYGIIGYMDNYVFTLQQSIRFLAKDGQQCRVVIVLKEHSPFTHSYFERPYFTYDTECLEMSN